MHIRKAHLNDLDSMVSLIINFYKEGANIEPQITKLIKNPKQEFTKYLKKSLDSRNAIIYLAEVDNKIVGFIRCVINSNEPFFKIKKISKLTDFYVIYEYRGKGIGSKLFEKTLSWCIKKKAPNIFLGTLSKNKKTNKMYLDKGFTEFEKSYWKKIN